jgi:predicted nucleic acid-binding protein
VKSVIDTSALISLARIAYLELIPMLRTDVVIPHQVYEEAVTKGEEKGFADATVIRRFLEKYQVQQVAAIKTDSVTALRKKVSKSLTEGDEAVLSLAIQEKAKEIVADDDGLGKIALALGFDVKASPDLLVEGLRKNRLSHEDFEVLIRELVIENRLSSAVAELYILEGRKDVKR